MVESGHNIFMQRCLEIASKAEGATYPNPLVGSVIVHDGKIIGEGYHLKAGDRHAEVMAIDSVSDKSLLKHSTLYVNLEPCSHFGKTPPCADLIISHGIPRVVIGTIDTSDKVAGGGIKRLQDAGCNVITGVREKDCRRINRRFFTFNEKKRPYITLKWAQSADGYLDKVRTKDQNPGTNWITGKPERILVHRWRTSEQAILAGAGTIRTDDPLLNVRDWPGRQPVRLILSASGSLDKNSSVFKSAGTNERVVVFTCNEESNYPGALKVKLNKEISSSEQVADYLYNNGIQSLFIEGGANVINHFISTGYWDEAKIFTGVNFFKGGLRAPLIKGTLLSRKGYTDSSLEIYLNE